MPAAPPSMECCARRARICVALKVDRTPTFFVNGKPLPSFGQQELFDLVNSEVRRAQQAVTAR